MLQDILASPKVEVGDLEHRSSISFPEQRTNVAFEAQRFMFAGCIHSSPPVISPDGTQTVSLAWTQESAYPLSMLQNETRDAGIDGRSGVDSVR